MAPNVKAPEEEAEDTEPQNVINSMETFYRSLSIKKPDILHEYLSYKAINHYLNYVNCRYPHCTIVHTIGKTYEGRDIKAIEINHSYSARSAIKNPASKFPVQHQTAEEFLKSILTQPPLEKSSNRNIVFIEGGAHAREWLSISVALHCIYQLTERGLRNSEIVKGLRFFIVPLLNPDGYEYTREKNKNWRKNRSPILPNKRHIGVDCNRNYDFHWEQGPRTSESLSTFKGVQPFSEYETQAIRDLLQKLAPNLLLFLTLHSYAQSIMYPWGYTSDLPTKNLAEMQKIADCGCEAIRKYSGRKYRAGTISSLRKAKIGGSVVDYAFGVIKVPYALVMELPGKLYGFQPPRDKISSLGYESWVGIRQMCADASALYTERCREKKLNFRCDF